MSHITEMKQYCMANVYRRFKIILRRADVASVREERQIREGRVKGTQRIDEKVAIDNTPLQQASMFHLNDYLSDYLG